MDDQAPQEIGGALGRIEQKIDGYAASTDRLLHRHEEAISENRKSIGKLQDFQSRTKGMAAAGGILLALLGLIGTAVAYAKDLFR